MLDSKQTKLVNLGLIKIGSIGVYNDGTFSGTTKEEEEFALNYENLRNVEIIEKLYLEQRRALTRRTASTDGERPRRYSDKGITAQLELYNEYRSLLALGIEVAGVEPLTDTQKKALTITYQFGLLLSAVADKTTNLALAGDSEWVTIYNKAKSIKLGITEVNEETLKALHDEFGV